MGHFDYKEFQKLETGAIMHRERILIVDDEQPNRDLLRDILKPMGYLLREAEDGQKALDAVEKEIPDLILCDVIMPKMNGYEVCQRLKSDPRTRLVPMIMLTSLDQLSDKLVAVGLGVDDYLTKPYNVIELTTRVRSLLSLKHFTDELEHATRVLESIALVVESRDLHTGNHCKHMSENAMKVGRAFGLPDDDIKTLQLGGVFHDLGKVAVPDAILNKPGKLTVEEFTIMKTHPAVGAELCKGMRSLERVIPIIRHHHEKLDGSGYPDGLRGDQIPLLVRIISVADVYDALSSKRSYKEAMPVQKCLASLREEVEKGWWDRQVVDTLGMIVSAGPVTA